MSETVNIAHHVRVLGGTLTSLDGLAPPRQLNSAPLIIGRDPLCEVVIPDKTVSSFHAELRATERGVLVKDLGSTNGVHVDGVHVVEGYIVRPATLQIASHRFSFAPSAFQVEVGSSLMFGKLIGVADVMQRLLGELVRISATDLGVLITGETGTGKGLVAHGLHATGTRAAREFVAIDCTSIPSQLAESELFGYERGAFTGAVQRRVSPFVVANGGTVFLDEIGELPLDVQPKLLRVLEERRVKPVGSNAWVPVDVRVIAATHRNLQREVNAGRFRADLYYRLKHVVIDMPPLRERREDIPLLAERFAGEFGKSAEFARLSEGAMGRLLAYDWPGNVRELRHALEATLALAAASGKIEMRGELSSASGELGGAGAIDTQSVVSHEEHERTYWSHLSKVFGGNQTAIARAARMSRAATQEKLIKYGPDPSPREGGT